MEIGWKGGIDAQVDFATLAQGGMANGWHSREEMKGRRENQFSLLKEFLAFCALFVARALFVSLCAD